MRFRLFRFDEHALNGIATLLSLRGPKKVTKESPFRNRNAAMASLPAGRRFQQRGSGPLAEIETHAIASTTHRHRFRIADVVVSHDRSLFFLPQSWSGSSACPVDAHPKSRPLILPVPGFAFGNPFDSSCQAFRPGLVRLRFLQPCNILPPMTPNGPAPGPARRGRSPPFTRAMCWLSSTSLS